ncbi:hypothetical protein [Limosilactobacillus portuensis]|uniref:hypothetical protein n=1 Tax=Limosilactobacillus portuensis TaxID=2742601 RepID=UPI003266B580
MKIKKLQRELSKVDTNLICEVVKRDEDFNGFGPLRITVESIGMVLIKYNDVLLLTMAEDDHTPVLKFAFEEMDKESSMLFAKVIELCGKYLPESEADHGTRRKSNDKRRV